MKIPREEIFETLPFAKWAFPGTQRFSLLEIHAATVSVTQVPKEIRAELQRAHTKSPASQACGISRPWPVPAEAHTGYKQPVACYQQCQNHKVLPSSKSHRNQIYQSLFLTYWSSYTMCHLCQWRFSHVGQQRPWKLLRFKPLNANLTGGNA